ncbi:MAG: hypothetical protein V5783_01595 [Pontiella sp.]
MKISIFIDYDNLTPQQKNLGIKGVVQKVLLLDDFATSKTRGECTIRLYGGWYEGEGLTASAEMLIAEIGDSFPTILSAKGEMTIRLSTQAELAYSMSETPREHLFGTYRKKQFPYNIRCTSPTTLGCCDNACPLVVLKNFLRKRKCPNEGCNIDISQFLYRNEQKLVDTMLTCDILYSHKVFPNGHVYVVSSDDDILPAVNTLSARGMQVVRVHTKPTSNQLYGNNTCQHTERSIA